MDQRFKPQPCGQGQWRQGQVGLGSSFPSPCLSSHCPTVCPQAMKPDFACSPKLTAVLDSNWSYITSEP